MSTVLNSTISQAMGPVDIPSGLTAPLIFGSLINWLLFGVLSVQTFIYHLNFPDDSTGNKILVYSAYCVEMAQTGLNGFDSFFWFASGHGGFTNLGLVNVSPLTVPILCGVIASIVQGFFVYRIFTLRKSYWWICIIIVLLSILQLIGSAAQGYRAFKLQQFSEFHDNVLFPQSFDVWSISNALCDVIIAGTLIWILRTSEGNGINQANHVLRKLVRLIVETNTLTASVALVSVIVYSALPSTNVFVATTLVTGKLYSNTLLVTFNNRIAMRHLLKPAVYDGNNMRIRQQTDISIKVDPSQSALDSISDSPSTQLESYEFQTLGGNKVSTLTEVV